MDKTSAQTQLSYLRRNSLEPEALDEDRNEIVRSFLGIQGGFFLEKESVK
jgi:hypothetical protein